MECDENGGKRQLRVQIQPRKSFQSYPFHKNLTDVTLVWGDNQHLKMHTKCSYLEPYKLVLGIRPYSSHLGQLNKNLPPMSTNKKTAQASDRILYKNLLHSVETFKKSNDFVDVPLVCDDGSVILAHKVILALTHSLLKHLQHFLLVISVYSFIFNTPSFTCHLQRDLRIARTESCPFGYKQGASRWALLHWLRRKHHPLSLALQCAVADDIVLFRDEYSWPRG